MDDKGLAGIELMWDKILLPSGHESSCQGIVRENSGYQPTLKRRALRRAGIGQSVSGFENPVIVEKRLDEGIAEHGAKWGSIVCIALTPEPSLQWPAGPPSTQT